jgi:hypothetical protein
MHVTVQGNLEQYLYIIKYRRNTSCAVFKYHTIKSNAVQGQVHAAIINLNINRRCDISFKPPAVLSLRTQAPLPFVQGAGWVSGRRSGRGRVELDHWSCRQSNPDYAVSFEVTVLIELSQLARPF